MNSTGKIDWRTVIVGSMMGVVGLAGVGAGLAGCSTAKASSISSAGSATDPNTRLFQGTIVSLRPATSTMLVSKDEHTQRDQFPNIISVKYDAQTQFFLDAAPATLDQIQQYMVVTVSGQMRDGQLVAESARFSSVLPANVRQAGARAGGT